MLELTVIYPRVVPTVPAVTTLVLLCVVPAVSAVVNPVLSRTLGVDVSVVDVSVTS